MYSEGLPSVTLWKGVYDFNRSADFILDSALRTSDVVDGRSR